MNRTLRRTANGFSLIEVMIAVVVLSFGLLALAALQGALFRAGAETKARATATALAQEVIEQGRSFAHIVKPSADYAGATYYDNLTSFTGKSVSAGGVTFSIGREVTRFNTAGAVIPDATPFDPVTPEYKLVTVKVGWSGSDGLAESVTITDAVASVAPADAMNVVKGPYTLPAGPQVWIEPPNKDNPAVVPIAVGDDKSAASSNPVPRRFANADTNTAATLFSVHTFTGSTTGDEVLLNRKLDVAAVTCNCSTAGSPVSTAFNPAYEPVVWSGRQLGYLEPTPLNSGTPIGKWVDDSTPNKDIRAMCTTCCRDHHESTTRKVRPDPHRALPAPHYLTVASNDGSYQIGDPVRGEYSEACQLVRVGGQMRITVDPKQNFLVSVALNPERTGHVPENFVQRYSALVVDYLQAGVSSLPGGYLSPQDQFPAFSIEKYAGNCSVDPTSDYCDILEPSSIPLTLDAAPRQMVAFGLYADYLTKETRLAYDCAGSKDESRRECDGMRDRNKMEVLPFYAINVANLGVWGPDSQGREWIAVTSPVYGNKGILTGEGGVVSRKSVRASNCGRVAFGITRSSSGIAGRLPIDPDDADGAKNPFDPTTPSSGNWTSDSLRFTPTELDACQTDVVLQ